MTRKKKELPKIGDMKIERGHTYEYQQVYYNDGIDNLEWICIDEEFEYLFGDSNIKPKTMKVKIKPKWINDEEADFIRYLNKFC